MAVGECADGNLLTCTSTRCAVQLVRVVNSHLSSPVLLLGILIGNKRYHCSKFFNVLLIVAGVSLFMYTEVRGEGGEGRGGEGRGGRGGEGRGEEGREGGRGLLCCALVRPSQ